MSSGQSSPVNGGYDSAVSEARLSVRKDLFPDVRHSSGASEDTDTHDDFDEVSYVKLETDFEQSIDDIQKQQKSNGLPPAPQRSRHKKHKQRSRRDADYSPPNGSFPKTKSKKRKISREPHPDRTDSVMLKLRGGKNLNLVSSSECRENEEEDEDTSEDEVLQPKVMLPVYTVTRPSGKPFSHELSQLSTKKSKKDPTKEKRTHAVIPCSGKPRTMLDIHSSHSKKKSKKSNVASQNITPTYQVVDSNTTLKIKIRRTNAQESKVVPITPPAPTSIADIGQRKSKKKRAASPAASVSSGEEYDPSRAETNAVITVAAPKPRQQAKARKTTPKGKGKSEKTDKSRVSAANKAEGPQSPWATMPEEVLAKIFENVISMQGTLPAVVRLGRVCRLWRTVSCRPELWRSLDLSQHTVEKCKTDYKLVWLLENRLSQCHTLNIAQWKVSKVSWVLTCVAEYCPDLKELSLAGMSGLLPEHLYDLFNSLPNLQRIDLSQTSETGGSGTCLSAASVARLMENFGSRLTHLTIANNKFTALQQILTSIAAHCANLEVLDISGAQATSHPGAVPLEALQKGCPKVRVFRAANAQLILANATTSQQMEVEGWPQLEELSIAGSAAVQDRVAVGEYKLGDEDLARLVRGANKLGLLDVRALQRLTDSGLVRVPAWDLQHLFLGGCNVTRKTNACLDLICEKWSHSLIELDLSWASAARELDDAVAALADAQDSKLRVLNLCGSSVSLEPVKKVLLRCRRIESLNLSSCRGLPRGMKRLLTGKELQDLKDSFDPEKAKAKEADKKKDSKSDTSTSSTPVHEVSKTPDPKTTPKPEEKIFQEPKSVPSDTKTSPDNYNMKSPSTPKLLSPAVQKPDSSCTPRSDSKTDIGSPHFSPMSKQETQSQESQTEPVRSTGSWNLMQFKTTPTHKSEASPLNKLETHVKMKRTIEQCSPTTSHDNKPSPETMAAKQDAMRTPNSYYGGYSPMTRQDQFSSQRSPYSAQPSPAQPSPYPAQPSPAQPSPYGAQPSPAQPSPYSTQPSPAQPSPYNAQPSPAQPSPYPAQPSPAQPSPYSTQPSPYSTQQSPYSSQPSPYSAQPSPDTSQIVKQDLQKNNAWNTGNYSPMPKQPAPFSPHPSPEASLKKPGGFSPMPRNRQSPAHSGARIPASTVEQPDPAWASVERFVSSTPSLESLVWNASEHWTGMPQSEPQRRTQLDDPWTMAHSQPNYDQPINFDAIAAHLQSHIPFMEENFPETSRVD